MNNNKIAVVVGSLRKESYSKKIAHALIELAPQGLSFEIVSLAELSVYNPDQDQSPPEAWTRFREQVKSCDGVLFVTPEYNRSVPGVLKNALDVGSRPYGQGVWQGKPGAVVSISVGLISGFGANHHLRQSLVFVNVPVMPQPEAYIAGVEKLFDQNGKLISESTSDFLKKFMEDFARWVDVLVPI